MALKRKKMVSLLQWKRGIFKLENSYASRTYWIINSNHCIFNGVARHVRAPLQFTLLTAGSWNLGYNWALKLVQRVKNLGDIISQELVFCENLSWRDKRLFHCRTKFLNLRKVHFLFTACWCIGKFIIWTGYQVPSYGLGGFCNGDLGWVHKNICLRDGPWEFWTGLMHLRCSRGRLIEQSWFYPVRLWECQKPVRHFYRMLVSSLLDRFGRCFIDICQI